MSETEMNIQFDMPKNRSNVIKVIGVGGGGSNAINHMFEQGINGVDFVICNTDSQALENSPVPTKVQLGVNLTEGLGAGANPEIGEQAALESFEDLKTLLDSNTKMVFITAGMGGGTGTGAAPIIAKQARDMGILTVGIVTIPFKFEGKVRNEQAQIGVEKLRRNVDSLIVIDNNKLREVYGNLGFKSGFSKADEVLSTASKGIAEVITHHYTQNIDLRDAKTVLSNSGTAIMGSAVAKGSSRAKEAIQSAMDSPLLNDNKITGAKNVLLLIVCGTEEITLDEIGEINDYIQGEAGNGANIIMGIGEDEDLGEAVSVTIIATGFAVEQQHEIVNKESKKIIHTLEDEQKAVHELSPKSYSSSSLPSRKVSDRPAAEKKAATKPKEEKKQDSDGRIIHTLDFGGEDFEDTEDTYEEPFRENMKLIPTSELIQELEVDYQEINFDEDDFVFIDSPEPKEKPVEPKPTMEWNEPMLMFDMPKADKPAPKKEEEPKERRKGSSGNAPFQNRVQPEVEEIEVEEEIELFPSEREQTKRYSLEDYLEKERELTEAKPEEEDEPFLRRETRRSRYAEDPVQEQEELPEIDPLNMPIAKELAARASERRARMKKFNYKFRKSTNIDEFEKQPAYKRAGLDLGSSHSENEGLSRTSINDDDDEIQLRRNNSFLHDNVD